MKMARLGALALRRAVRCISARPSARLLVGALLRLPTGRALGEFAQLLFAFFGQVQSGALGFLEQPVARRTEKLVFFFGARNRHAESKAEGQGHGAECKGIVLHGAGETILDPSHSFPCLVGHVAGRFLDAFRGVRRALFDLFDLLTSVVGSLLEWPVSVLAPAIFTGATRTLPRSIRPISSVT